VWGVDDIHITLPEFTCKCPFLVILTLPRSITYVLISGVELKALKLYINSYRDRYISHEESVNQILDDFVAVVTVHIKGVYLRGNVHR